MPMISVRIPASLRTWTAAPKTVRLEASTVEALLDALIASHPQLKAHLFEPSGSLRRFMNVYVNDEDIRGLSGLSTPLHSGDAVTLVPAMAGG